MAWLTAITLATACTRPVAEVKPLRETRSEPTPSTEVFAQGKLMPAGGVIQINATPGDRIEEVLVASGQLVQAQTPLAVLASQKLRQHELEIAQRRLQEAQSQSDAKKLDLRLQVQAAQAGLESAQVQLRQAEEQRELAETGAVQVDLAREQLRSLQRLTEDPRTRAMVGTVEFNQRKFELAQLEAKQSQAQSAARMAVDAARLGIDLAQRKLESAKEAEKLGDSFSPTGSLSMQIELLQKQIQQSRLLAPRDGTILSVSIEAGEMATQMPLMEMADLSQMSCWAEVHESDVSRLAIGQSATLTSAALPRALKGKVVRIDRMVGSPQMRTPNPMARTDFRAVPIWIDIESDDAPLASQLIQLQVEVKIDTSSQTQSPP